MRIPTEPEALLSQIATARGALAVAQQAFRDDLKAADAEGRLLTRAEVMTHWGEICRATQFLHRRRKLAKRLGIYAPPARRPR